MPDQEPSTDAEMIEYLVLFVEALVQRLGGDVMVRPEEMREAANRESLWELHDSCWCVQLGGVPRSKR